MKRSERNEVIDVVKSEIKNFVQDQLDKEVKEVLRKTSTESRKEMIDAIKDSLEAAFKVFWYKRNFWKADIK